MQMKLGFRKPMQVLLRFETSVIVQLRDSQDVQAVRDVAPRCLLPRKRCILRGGRDLFEGDVFQAEIRPEPWPVGIIEGIDLSIRTSLVVTECCCDHFFGCL